MRKIKKLSIKQSEICDLCTSLNYRDRVIEKSEEYEKNLNNIASLKAEEKRFIEENPDFKKNMMNQYKYLTYEKQYPERYEYYKKIKNTTSKCPYCSFLSRTVTQLDHYLPKSEYPTYAITVSNLVPICQTCNDIKDTHSPSNQEEMLLHPYYDDLMNDVHKFVNCKIIEEKNIGFVYSIKKLDYWDDVTYKRVKLHFSTLGLDKLYLSSFIDDFDTFRGDVLKFISSFGMTFVEMALKNRVATLKEENNKPWLHAGYKALNESDWVVDEYFPSLRSDTKST